MRFRHNARILTDELGLWYGVFVVLFLALLVAAVHFLTIEPDEAWALLSTGQLVGGPFERAGFVSSPVVTSGGLHTLIHYALLRGALPIEAHRLVSVVFSVLTLGMIFFLAKAQWSSASAGLVAAAAFLTCPGFLLQAGLATAEMMSTFLLIGAAWHWTVRGSASLAGSVLSGVLFGLSCATRMSALIALPAIVIWSLLYQRTVPRAILHGVVAATIGLAFLLLSVSAYYALFSTNDLQAFAHNLGWATGFGQRKGVPWLLSYFATSESMFPAAVMTVAGVALIQSPQQGPFSAIRPLCVMLLLIGVIGWAAWIVKAPIPHLRYLWPALPALWLCGIVLLLERLMALAPGRARLLLHVTFISVLATQFALSLRQVAYGDSLALVYEAARRAPTGWFKSFRARQDQERLASVVASLPADAQIYALIEPVAHPITWLTGRGIYQLSTLPDRPQVDRYLILFPSDKNIWTPTLAAMNWIQANATLHARVNDYSLYRIKADAPGPGTSFSVDIGGQPHPL